jgi:hypothetical protein
VNAGVPATTRVVLADGRHQAAHDEADTSWCRCHRRSGPRNDSECIRTNQCKFSHEKQALGNFCLFYNVENKFFFKLEQSETIEGRSKKCWVAIQGPMISYLAAPLLFLLLPKLEKKVEKLRSLSPYRRFTC